MPPLKKKIEDKEKSSKDQKKGEKTKPEKAKGGQRKKTKVSAAAVAASLGHPLTRSSPIKGPSPPRDNSFSGSSDEEGDGGGSDTNSIPSGQAQTHQVVTINMTVEKKIAAFYEANPMFYDKTSDDFKNKPKRNAVLKEFADSIHMDREYNNP